MVLRPEDDIEVPQAEDSGISGSWVWTPLPNKWVAFTLKPPQKRYPQKTDTAIGWLFRMNMDKFESLSGLRSRRVLCSSQMHYR